MPTQLERGRRRWRIPHPIDRPAHSEMRAMVGDNVRGREEVHKTSLQVMQNMPPRDWNSPSRKRIEDLLRLLKQQAPTNEAELHQLCVRLIEWYGYQEELLKGTPEGKIAFAKGDYSRTLEPLWDIVRGHAGSTPFPARPVSMIGLTTNAVKSEVERVMDWCTRRGQFSQSTESHPRNPVARKKPIRVPSKWKKLLRQWKQHQKEMQNAAKRATLTEIGTFSLYLPKIKVHIPDKTLAEFRDWYNGHYKPSLTKNTLV